MDIYFSDFNEETQKAILKEARLNSPEEANWDVLPITCLDFEYEEEEIMKKEERYPYLHQAVTSDVFKRMQHNFPDFLDNWNEECRWYEFATDEEVGKGGENLSRFLVAVYGAGETIEEYLDELEEY